MAAPTDYPDWATSDDYNSGPDAGNPTKIEPTSGEIENGNVRGTPPSPQKFNWWQNLVGRWVRNFAEELPTKVTAGSASYAMSTGDTSPVELTVGSDHLSGPYTLGDGNTSIQVPAAGRYLVSVSGIMRSTSVSEGTTVEIWVRVNGDPKMIAHGERRTTSATERVHVENTHPIEILDPPNEKITITLENSGAGNVPSLIETGTLRRTFSIVRIS